MTTATTAPASGVPAHVPPELVRNFSHFTSPGMLPEPGACPYRTMQKLHEEPRIFYAPAEGRMLSGNWVITRAEDQRRILQDTDTFSSYQIAGFAQLLGESWGMIPLEIDPPDHAKWRTLLNPLFTPRRIEQMTNGIRDVAVELIEEIRAQKRCEFVQDFARRFPVRIFMQLMGLPLKDYGRIMAWEEEILHSPDMNVRVRGAQSIRVYLEELMAESERNPNDSLMSYVCNGSVEGRPLEQWEKLSICLFLFVAGLDTVASSLGYQFRYLAQHPEVQTLLRNEPERIPTAVEELIRAFSVVVTSRKVTQDVEVGGVQLKKGDVVSLPLGLANYDPEAFDRAAEVDLGRTPNRHLGFTVGPHRCIGSNLARKELVVAIEEWTQRIPNFRVVPGTEPIARGGAVFGVDRLELVWD